MSPQPPQTRRATTAGKSPLITQQQTRPTSARTPITPRPSSAGPNQTPQGSRPTSARVVQSMDESRLDNGEPDPVPQEAFMDQGHQAPDGMDEDGQQTETIQMPSAEETGQ